MPEFIYLAIGLVLVTEGILYALFPSFMKDLMEQMRQMTPDILRFSGLGAIILGAVFLWLFKITS
ncbi:MAG: DUF2065 domain-containing protein [Parvibaculales bacterium]